MLAPWRKIYEKGRQCIKKQRDYFANKCPYTQNYYFSNSHVWMCELDHEEGWTPKNWFFWTVVLEKTPENHLDFKEIQSVDPKRKSILNVHWKDWCWSSNILAMWCKEPIHWKRPWCWERLRAGEGGNRGWDSWMASPTQWTWVWANSERQWKAEAPGVLQFTGSQRVRHNRVSEQQQWLNEVRNLTLKKT